MAALQAVDKGSIPLRSTIFLCRCDEIGKRTRLKIEVLSVQVRPPIPFSFISFSFNGKTKDCKSLDASSILAYESKFFDIRIVVSDAGAGR